MMPMLFAHWNRLFHRDRPSVSSHSVRQRRPRRSLVTTLSDENSVLFIFYAYLLCYRPWWLS